VDLKNIDIQCPVVTIGHIFRAISGLMCQASTKTKKNGPDLLKDLEKCPLTIVIDKKQFPVKRIKFDGNNLILEEV